MIRWNLVNTASDEAQLATPGENVNEQYEGVLKLLKANAKLSNSEKIEAERNFTFMKDRENLVRLKGPTYLCKQCNRSGYTILFCELCARDHLTKNFVNWTSGNKIIDQAIQQSQINLPLPRYIIEWIPYDDLEDIKYKTHGGCAQIFIAVWKKGVILSFSNKKQEFERSSPGIVILKKLLDSQHASTQFLEELKVHILLGSKGYTVATCYGITRDPSTGEYILVLAHYQQDFSSYIKESADITWKDIYSIFYNVSEDLYNMHAENLIHRDLHSKNVLKSKGNLFHLSDFGICGPANKQPSEIYGNLPFTAPEVLLDRKYTTAVDIYSMGMLMYHATTGHPPFFNRIHDTLLAYEIYEAALQKPDTLVRDSVTSRIQTTGNIHEGQSSTLVENDVASRMLMMGDIQESQSTLIENNVTSRMLMMEDSQSTIYSLEILPDLRNASKVNDSGIVKPSTVSNVVWQKPDYQNRKKPNLIKKGHLVLLKPPDRTN
ncbi:1469_t:CDS:2 [Ambispora gerdemannii]|uniref:1469_t:CDS:1 n=1 Tax=Ambispora gerdemannii TaxID=144530 RepID=A0A9N9AHC5_9GLOM|nr:1469_t:CDS:2 [Ambispora gerdemannii]